jgi:hypothetical protein
VSKSVALEFPELRVRRVIVRDGAAATNATAGATAGAATDATLRRVVRAACADDAALENDLLMTLFGGTLRRFDLAALRLTAPPPVVERSASRRPLAALVAGGGSGGSGVLLLTGATGGLGGELLKWLVHAQRVPPHAIVVLSRRARSAMATGALRGSAPVAAVGVITGASPGRAALRACAPLRALENVRGIFHLAGMLDDGVVTNMTARRIRSVVAPKAAALTLLDAAAECGWSTEWLVAYSSTTSLLGCVARRYFFVYRASLSLPLSLFLSLSSSLSLSLSFSLSVGLSLSLSLSFFRSHTVTSPPPSISLQRQRSVTTTPQVPGAIELRRGKHAARSRCAVRRRRMGDHGAAGRIAGRIATAARRRAELGALGRGGHGARRHEGARDGAAQRRAAALHRGIVRSIRARAVHRAFLHSRFVHAARDLPHALGTHRVARRRDRERRDGAQ